MSPSKRSPSTITMREVADRAGVSLMTVSYALREDPRIPAATREKVKNAAKALGYKVNPLVSALMAQRRSGKTEESGSNLAVLLPGRKISGNNLEGHLPGARARAEDRGYGLDLFYMEEEGDSGKHLTRVLRARNIHGVLIPHLNQQTQLEGDWRFFSVVAHGYTLLEPHFHRVVSDLYHGALLALERLTGLGYRRIGLLMSEATSRNTHHLWRAAYLMHQASLPARQRLPEILLNLEHWQTPLQKWNDRHQPEVILHNFPRLRPFLEEQGLQVPEDVALAYLDMKVSPGPELSGVAGIDQRWEAVGEAMVDVLIAKMHANERGIPDMPRTVLVPPKWVDGPTAPKRRDG
ncbi:MAG: LacI family DNA-binding transcriptional regulator [Kiritimatiellia bacterium]